MALGRFIKFVAGKANSGSADHEKFLEDAADQYPEIVDDVIGAYISTEQPAAVIEDAPPVEEAWPVTDETDHDGELWCAGHQVWHPKSEFWKNSSRPERGYHSSCKAYYERNKNGASKPATTVNFLASVPVAHEPRKVYVSHMSMLRRKELDAVAPVGTWICTRCLSYRPAECFNKDNTKPHLKYRDYARTVCKDCQHK